LSEISIVNFKERCPDLYKKIFEAGQKAEREKFQVLKELCGGDFELLAECFVEGRSPEDALRLRVFKADYGEKAGGIEVFYQDALHGYERKSRPIPNEESGDTK